MASGTRPPPPLPGRAAPRRVATGYRAGIGRAHAARWQALLLALAALFAALPAAPHFALTSAPAWARWSWGFAAVLTLYAAFVALAPDWTALRVAGWAFATAAVLYAIAAGLLLFTPRWRAAAFGLEEASSRGAAWCLAVVLVDATAGYLALRAAHRWQVGVLRRGER